ncbi:DNA-processing protein DprA [Nocardia puris]|uniref:Putative Rossmann fold nucleotide-binding protein DprA/Smf involved in DNA uptake n=1 Tax=Nocardia puris TaxID=208602 RepID=A0A366D5C0_9NOCA|nr:DNA-processing protein DprA [Nocardia puris]MBF6370288.1 DNA-processing protein DprA [Nocardia puris]RBO85155.1 putative Rossmann fold nucleotide-binding protein DprA/Smf involved in DNA uptake [Nocardia puris]
MISRTPMTPLGWAVLARAGHINRSATHRLIDRYGLPAAAARLARGHDGFPAGLAECARCDLDRAAAAGAVLLTPADSRWPRARMNRLRAHRPLALWVSGPLGALSRPSRVALLGETPVAELAGEFVTRGVDVALSGDAASVPSTPEAVGAGVLAVCGGGLTAADTGSRSVEVYASRRAVLVSEAPPGTLADSASQLSGHRLLLALSDAVVISSAGRGIVANVRDWAAFLNQPVLTMPSATVAGAAPVGPGLVERAITAATQHLASAS